MEGDLTGQYVSSVADGVNCNAMLTLGDLGTTGAQRAV